MYHLALQHFSETAVANIKQKIMYPDYNKSLLGAANSVLAHYSVKTSHNTMTYLDYNLNWNFRNVVFLVLDGLGSIVLEHHLKKEMFLRRFKALDISSVFPSTTAAAATTLQTGKTPIEHGWLGWSLYFKEVNKNVDLYPNTVSGTKDTQAADYNLAQKHMPYIPAHLAVAAANPNVNAEFFATFTPNPPQKFEELCGMILNAAKKPGRNFIAAHWDEPDSTMHLHGTSSPEAYHVILDINRELEKLAASLKKTDTLLIITSDHGMIDVQYKFLADYPLISECLIRPASMEPRAVNFFVRPEKREHFAALFDDTFGDSFMLLTKERLLEREYLGHGTPHQKTNDFLGGYVAIATQTTAIANARPTHRAPFAATHSGLTEAEMLVPLVILEIK